MFYKAFWGRGYLPSYDKDQKAVKNQHNRTDNRLTWYLDLNTADPYNLLQKREKPGCKYRH